MKYSFNTSEVNKLFLLSKLTHLQLNKPAPGQAGDPKAGSSTEGGAEDVDQVPDDITNYYDKLDREDEDDMESLKTVSFEVKQESIEDIQKR